MKIPESIFNTLSDDQKRKVEAAASPEELVALAKETGYELSPEHLEGISGGWCDKCIGYNPECPVYMIH